MSVLEPVIITFNRAAHLKKTLDAFFNAGWPSIVHVLDNASTDQTTAVVKEFQKTWPGLHYHKNIYNISGNGNILRSVELSSVEYHWVVGDDDEWLFEDAKLKELLSVLEKNQADIIRLGWLVSKTSRGMLVSASHLIAKEDLFFASVSMISATIIRRDLVAKYLPLSYQNTADHYPHLVPIIRGVEEGEVKIYTLSQDIMRHIPSQEPGVLFGDFDWYSGWFRTSRFFSKKSSAKKFVNEIAVYMCKGQKDFFRQWLWFLKVLLYYKSFGIQQTPYLLSMLGYGNGFKGRILSLLVVNACLPMRVAACLKRLFFLILGRKNKSLKRDPSRL